MHAGFKKRGICNCTSMNSSRDELRFATWTWRTTRKRQANTIEFGATKVLYYVHFIGIGSTGKMNATTPQVCYFVMRFVKKSMLLNPKHIQIKTCNQNLVYFYINKCTENSGIHFMQKYLRKLKIMQNIHSSNVKFTSSIWPVVPHFIQWNISYFIIPGLGICDSDHIQFTNLLQVFSTGI